MTQDVNVLKDYAYLYDKAGNRVHENIDGIGIQREFNEVNQFVNDNIPDAPVRISGKTNKETFVTIDGHPVERLPGNRFEAWMDAEPGTVNQFEIVARDDEGNMRTENYEVDVPAATPQAFTYDEDGNLFTDGTRIFVWDAKNQLVTFDNRTTTEFVYDSQGRRIRMIEQDEFGAITADKRYWWLDGSTQPFEERTHNASGTLVSTRRFYKRGEIEYNSSGAVVNVRFYTKDHTGSVRDLIDSNGNVVASYDYDPYGRRTTLTGNTADTVVSYTGHHWHEKSGVYLTMTRQYDPELGRWLSRDSLENAEMSQGPNLYTYVANNPMIYIDPNGTDIRLTEGNKIVNVKGWKNYTKNYTNYKFHQEVSVDTWDETGKIKTGEKCFSFGKIDGAEGLSINVSKGEETYGLKLTGEKTSGVSLNVKGAVLDVSIIGAVYSPPVPQGIKTLDTIKTTVEQDRDFLQRMNARLGEKGEYGAGYTCRNFSQEVFEDAKERYKKKNP